MVAITSQAALAVKVPEGRRERAVLEFGDDLLDDRVAAVRSLSVEHPQGAVGEYGVVAPGRQELAR